MGLNISPVRFTHQQRAGYRGKLRRCLDVLALMLRDGGFEGDRPNTGIELELNLIDPQGEPAMRNAEILAALADPGFQTELGRFNLEVNTAPRLISGSGFEDYERVLADSLSRAAERAAKVDARVVLIGTLPR